MGRKDRRGGGAAEVGGGGGGDEPTLTANQIRRGGSVGARSLTRSRTKIRWSLSKQMC